MKKGIKFKLATLLALFIGRSADNASAQIVAQHDDTVKKEVKVWPDDLSVKQVEEAIKRCDTVLARLKKTIDTKGISPQERYDADRAYANIIQERKRWEKKLEELRTEQKKTIDIRDAARAR